MSSDWTCTLHGAVVPLAPPHPPSGAWLREVAARARVPVWLPWPLPTGWLLTGVGEAGTERGGTAATVVACSGPNPAPDPANPAEHPADLLVVAEQPGIGLGARLAGLDDIDPGAAVATGPAHAKVRAGGHPTPLWHVDGPPDRAAYVGESGGVWLWLLLWPASAGVLVLESLDLVDVREGGQAIDPPTGALSPRLV
jgi:hypothetical protein